MIGQGVSVGPLCYVGAHSNVGDGTKMLTGSIRWGSLYHWRKRCLLGMRSVIGYRCTVGDQCILPDWRYHRCRWIWFCANGCRV